jgi:Host cell surface-exposed lipoprotein
MPDSIIHQAYGQPFPGGPQPPAGKQEAKNDALAWSAFLFGWLWPLGLILGHSSNRSAKREDRRRSVLTIIGLCEAYFFLAITVIFIIAGIAGGASSSGSPATITPTPAVTAPAAPTPAPATSEPQTATPAPAPAKPTITVSQEQALASAKSYLDMGNGFSRAGLIRQLKFEKFSTADATWAADHSGANWYSQAVLSARGYIKLGTGFSRQSLIDQLTSPYGEQYTLAQATYAANQVGL